MGFFFSNQRQQKTKSRTQPSLSILSYSQQCKVCPLRKEILSHPKMKPTGVVDPIIYNLGEAPGENEDKSGIQFIGKAGDLLRTELDEVFGRRFVEDSMRWSNCIRCRPPANRKPTEQELQCCKKSVEQDIEETQPLVIIGYGGVPLKWMLNVDGIRDLWRGRRIPVKIGSHTAWYFPVLHPSFVLRNQRVDKIGRKIETDWDRIFKRDLQNIHNFLTQKDIPVAEVIDSDYESCITIVDGTQPADYEIIEDALERMEKYPEIALDIENIPLKPWLDKDFRLVSVSIGIDKDVIAYSLEHPKAWNGNYEKILKLTKDFLLNYKGVIYCHNLKHELMVFYWYFGERVLRTAKWGCTQRMAYVIDERTSDKRNMGMLGLGRLCLIHLGFDLKQLVDIDFENMLDEPLDKVLLYNGRDSKYTFSLVGKQEPWLKGKLKNVYEHHVRNAITLAITETEGLDVNIEEIKKLSKDLDKQIAIVEKNILSLLEVEEYEKKYGEFKHSSNKDLIVMFRDVFGYKKVKASSKDKDGKERGYSVDESVMKVFMEEHNNKLAEYVLEFRGLAKLKSTYLDNILTKLSPVDGKLHTQFNDTLTTTGRFSSESPNLQNFPKKKNKHIRAIITAIKRIFKSLRRTVI